jgi:endonuclease/exonuclease/phosphatase family metal-dependent hydrolase
MIVATFNVENLFERPRAMNLPTWREGQPALTAAAELNALFNRTVYTEADKRKMLHRLAKFGLVAARSNDPFLTLRTIRGQLLERKATQPPRIVANGRADWTGWIELKREPIADPAITNTARVIAEVNPDILVLVEVEHRPALQHFHDKVLAPLTPEPYPYNMVIDGNDERGIDVGILSRFPICSMRSHLTDRPKKSSTNRTFSRDCPEYYIELPSGRELLILPNHFASKGSDRTGARRKVQANAVRAIYEGLKKRYPLALVAGDLNDHPGGGSLNALLKRTDLVDAMSLKQYEGEFPGTYQRGTANEKIDYLLLSPALQRKVETVSVFRKGYYAPRKWESFENINAENRERFQASDHHCAWMAVEL